VCDEDLSIYQTYLLIKIKFIHLSNLSTDQILHQAHFSECVY